LEELLPRLGTELALVVYSASEPLRPQALLCIYSVLSLGTDSKQRDEMVYSLQASLDQVAYESPFLDVRGLLLRGECLDNKEPMKPRHGRLDYLAAPAGGPFWFQAFPVLLGVLLEELTG
jgi:hypothetical protein